MNGTKKLAAVFAMPVAVASYNAMAAGSVLPDYGGSTFRGQTPDDVWSLRYERVVAAARELITEILEMEGAVYTDATLGNLSAAARQTDTLLLFAHWKGHAVAASDLQASPIDLLAKISSSNNACLRHYQSKMATLLGEPDPEQIAAILTDGISDGSLLQQATEVQKLAGSSKLVAAALSRDLLDEALKGYIQPGNRIEMFDGLHAPRELARALGPFEGEIDLGTCYSMALATYLAIWKPRGVHIVHTRDAIDPLASYTTTQHVLSLWRDIGGRYGRIRMEVDRKLNQLLKHRGN